MFLAPTGTVAPPALPDNFKCDFETDLCTMQQARDDVFDWVRNRGATQSSNTGPSVDNTKVSIADQKSNLIFSYITY